MTESQMSQPKPDSTARRQEPLGYFMDPAEWARKWDTLVSTEHHRTDSGGAWKGDAPREQR